MSKELKNITESVMGKIHQGEVKMRPKMYFVAGSALTFLGLVFSLATSVFLVGLIRFSIRSHGGVGGYRFQQMIESFPLWVPIFAILTLCIGVWLLRYYDFSYKKNYPLIIMVVVIAVIITGLFIDSIGLHDSLARRGHMRGMMKGHGGEFKTFKYNQNMLRGE
jgi:hypothetical protein